MNKAPSNPEAYASCDELLQGSELTDIRYYELQTSRHELSDEATWRLNVLNRVEGVEFIVRCKVEVEGERASFMVDGAAVFTLSEPRTISDEVMREFSERVGVMALFPYLRTAVFNLASQLGVDRPVLPLLRQGMVRLTKPDD